MSKKLLFSIDMRHCVVDTFTSSGKGGQHRNRNKTAVRVKHPASGAVGEASEFKSQMRNKKAAFKRMAESKEFQLWARLRAYEIMGLPSPEEIVEEQMKENNLKIEVRDQNSGKWVVERS